MNIETSVADEAPPRRTRYRPGPGEPPLPATPPRRRHGTLLGRGVVAGVLLLATLGAVKAFGPWGLAVVPVAALPVAFVQPNARRRR